MTKLFKDRVVLGLIALAMIQVGVVGYRMADGGELEGSWISTGQSLAEVRTTDADGRVTSLASGAPTLLLAFHSECEHCLRLAPIWREWLESHGDEVRTLAVSREDLSTATAYALEHGWPTKVARVDVPERGTTEHALTARTPWVFVVDAGGVVIAEGQGALIDELGSLLLEDSRPASTTAP